jgi:hypothetical protein
MLTGKTQLDLQLYYNRIQEYNLSQKTILNLVQDRLSNEGSLEMILLFIFHNCFDYIGFKGCVCYWASYYTHLFTFN